MPATLLGAQVEHFTSEVQTWLTIARPAGCVWLDWSQSGTAGAQWYKQTIGGILWGRIHEEANLLDSIAAKHAELGGLVFAWLLWNEPGRDPATIRRVATDTIAAVKYLSPRGIRLYGGCWGEGSPELADWQLFYAAMYALWKAGGGVSVHEYDAPTMQCSSPWRCGRIGQAWQTWPADLRGIPILVGECGIDRGVSDTDAPHMALGWHTVPGAGWLYNQSGFTTTEAGYLNQLAWYDTLCQRRPGPNIVQAAVFTVGAYPAGKWVTFDVIRALTIAGYIGGRSKLPMSLAAMPGSVPGGGGILDEATKQALLLRYNILWGRANDTDTRAAELVTRAKALRVQADNLDAVAALLRQYATDERTIIADTKHILGLA